MSDLSEFPVFLGIGGIVQKGCHVVIFPKSWYGEQFKVLALESNCGHLNPPPLNFYELWDPIYKTGAVVATSWKLYCEIDLTLSI